MFTNTCGEYRANNDWQRRQDLQVEVNIINDTIGDTYLGLLLHEKGIDEKDMLKDMKPNKSEDI